MVPGFLPGQLFLDFLSSPVKWINLPFKTPNQLRIPIRGLHCLHVGVQNKRKFVHIVCIKIEVTSSTSSEPGWNGWKRWVASADISAGVNFRVSSTFCTLGQQLHEFPPSWRSSRKSALHGESLVMTLPRPNRVSTKNGRKSQKSVLLEHLNQINQNWFRLKRLIPIEHALRIALTANVRFVFPDL